MNQSINPGLTKLPSLDLSDQAITEIEGGAFSDCGNVEQLILSGNDLSILRTDAFKGMVRYLHTGLFVPSLLIG